MDATAAALKSAQSAAATLAARRAESNAAVQEAVYARVLHTFTRIAAPMDGLIVAREAEAGDTLVPGSPIFSGPRAFRSRGAARYLATSQLPSHRPSLGRSPRAGLGEPGAESCG